MDKIVEKLNKLSLPVVILIASVILGGFFYANQVSKQRSIERQQQIKIEQEKQAKEEVEQALNTCIDDAKSKYLDMWHGECKARGKLTNKCIDIYELSFDEYLEKYGLITTEEYVKEGASDECFCRLLVSTADRFNESLEKDKAECFKRYPQQ